MAGSSLDNAVVELVNVEALERLGYGTREAHPFRRPQQPPARQRAWGRRPAAVSRDLRRAPGVVGAGHEPSALAEFERGLTAVVGTGAARLDVPGWLSAGAPADRRA
jgi:hypothetical protein